MSSPLRIILDRFIYRRRLKEIYDTIFSCFLIIFLLFYKTDFWAIGLGASSVDFQQFGENGRCQRTVFYLSRSSAQPLRDAGIPLRLGLSIV